MTSRSIFRIGVVAGLGFITSLQPGPVSAGCGCDHPPPVPSSVFPRFAWADMPVSVYAPGAQAPETCVRIGDKKLRGRYGPGQGESDAGLCSGAAKPQVLVMEYTGSGCGASRNSQKPKHTKCEGNPGGSSRVRISAQQEDGRRHLWFEGEVNLGDRIELDATREQLTRLMKKTKVWVHDLQGNLLQEFKLRTGCDQPLFLGDQFGSLKLVGFVPEYKKTASLSRDDESRTRLLPDHIGPKAVRVYDAACDKLEKTTRVLADLPPSNFTVLPRPIPLVEIEGTVRYDGLDAAVGADGTLYVAFDLTNVSRPMQFFFILRDLPLRFDVDDVIYYNRDEYNLKLFTSFVSDPQNYQWGPYYGPTVEASRRRKDSQVIGYWRHEFESYKTAHLPRGTHEVDEDGLHPDGTAHVDHEHLILAIRGHTIDVDEPKNQAEWAPLPGGKVKLDVELLQLFSDSPVVAADFTRAQKRMLWDRRYEADFDVDDGVLEKVELKPRKKSFDEVIAATGDADPTSADDSD